MQQLKVTQVHTHTQKTDSHKLTEAEEIFLAEDERRDERAAEVAQYVLANEYPTRIFSTAEKEQELSNQKATCAHKSAG